LLLAWILVRDLSLLNKSFLLGLRDFFIPFVLPLLQGEPIDGKERTSRFIHIVDVYLGAILRRDGIVFGNVAGLFFHLQNILSHGHCCLAATASL